MLFWALLASGQINMRRVGRLTDPLPQLVAGIGAVSKDVT
jgi:hypothetical protein